MLGVNLAASEAVEQAMNEENADYVGLGASANPRRRFTDHEEEKGAGGMTYKAAEDLKPGELIDLEPIMEEFSEVDFDPEGVDASRFEYATVETVTPADDVDGIPAVLVATDQHTVKLPANFSVWVERTAQS